MSSQEQQARLRGGVAGSSNVPEVDLLEIIFKLLSPDRMICPELDFMPHVSSAIPKASMDVVLPVRDSSFDIAL